MVQPDEQLLLHDEQPELVLDPLHDPEHELEQPEHPLEVEDPAQEDEQLAEHAPEHPLIASSILMSLPQELRKGVAIIPAKMGKANFAEVLKNSLRVVIFLSSIVIFFYQIHKSHIFEMLNA